MNQIKQRETLGVLTQHHRSAQLEVNPKIVLSEVRISDAKLVARFSGTDDNASLNSATLVSSRGAVIAFLEARQPDRALFGRQPTRFSIRSNSSELRPNNSLERSRDR
jgi:hypothetical protein